METKEFIFWEYQGDTMNSDDFYHSNSSRSKNIFVWVVGDYDESLDEEWFSNHTAIPIKKDSCLRK